MLTAFVSSAVAADVAGLREAWAMSSGRGAEAAVPASRGSSGSFTSTAGASAALRCVCNLHVKYRSGHSSALQPSVV